MRRHVPLARRAGKVVRIHHRETQWYAAPFYQKPQSRTSTSLLSGISQVSICVFSGLKHSTDQIKFNGRYWVKGRASKEFALVFHCVCVSNCWPVKPKQAHGVMVGAPSLPIIQPSSEATNKTGQVIAPQDRQGRRFTNHIFSRVSKDVKANLSPFCDIRYCHRLRSPNPQADPLQQFATLTAICTIALRNPGQVKTIN